MINNINLKQRNDIPAFELSSKGFEEMLKLHAANKIEKKEIRAKVDSSSFTCKKKEEPSHLLRDECIIDVDEEE